MSSCPTASSAKTLSDATLLRYAERALKNVHLEALAPKVPCKLHPIRRYFQPFDALVIECTTVYGANLKGFHQYSAIYVLLLTLRILQQSTTKLVLGKLYPTRIPAYLFTKLGKIVNHYCVQGTRMGREGVSAILLYY